MTWGTPHRRARPSPPGGGLLLLALAAVVLAGCGEDETPSPAPAPATVTVTAAPGAPDATGADPAAPASDEPAQDPAVDPAGGPSGGPGEVVSDLPAFDLTQPPRSYAAALAHLDAVGQEPADLSRFTTPSGTLYCVLDDPVLPSSCELGEGAVEDRTVCPAAGATRFVGRVEFRRGRATPVCNSDTVRTPGPPVLPYGAAARRADGDITCLNERLGVTCVSRSHLDGFFLRRGLYVIF